MQQSQTTVGGFRGFVRGIRTRPRNENWADPAFAETANNLYAEFKSDASARDASAEKIQAYFELLRMDWGVEVIPSVVERLRDSGASTAVIAGAFLTSMNAGGRHEAAVPVLERLYLSSPADPVVALRLAESYSATGEFCKLRRLSREAAAGLNFGQWAVGQWAQLLVNALQLEEAALFIRRITKDEKLKAELELRMSSLTSGYGRFPIPSLVINLAQENRKLAITDKLLRAVGVYSMRLDAVDARNLPGYALRKLAADEGYLAAQGPSSIATALSHIKALESAARREKPTLILEDDVVPYASPDLDFLEDLYDDKLDLLFVNRRMSFPDLRQRGPRVVSAWSVLEKRKREYNGIGADAYFVTPSGANKILDLFVRDGIHGHYDWQLGAYAVATEASAQKPISASQKIVKQRLSRLSCPENFRTGALSIPLFTAVDHGVSNTTDISRELLATWA